MENKFVCVWGAQNHSLWCFFIGLWHGCCNELQPFEAKIKLSLLTVESLGAGTCLFPHKSLPFILGVKFNLDRPCPYDVCTWGCMCSFIVAIHPPKIEALNGYISKLSRSTLHNKKTILLDAIKRHCGNSLQKEGTYPTALHSSFKSLKLVQDRKCFCWQDS